MISPVTGNGKTWQKRRKLDGPPFLEQNHISVNLKTENETISDVIVNPNDSVIDTIKKRFDPSYYCVHMVRFRGDEITAEDTNSFEDYGIQDGATLSVGVSPLEVIVATTGDGVHFMLLTAEGNQVDASLPPLQRSVLWSPTTVAWSPNGGRLAIGTWSEEVGVWSLTAGKWKQEVILQQAPSCSSGDMVVKVEWSCDGKDLAVMSEDTVQVWSVSEGSWDLRNELDSWDKRHSFTSLAWSPGGGRLALSLGSEVNVWPWRRPGKGTVDSFQHFDHRPDDVLCVAWSPDGKRLATASDDENGGVKVWSVEDRRCEKTLNIFDNRVLSVAWSPNGEMIAAGDADGMVAVWSWLRGQDDALACSHMHTFNSCVRSVAWSPDGGKLVSGGDDGKVIVLFLVDVVDEDGASQQTRSIATCENVALGKRLKKHFDTFQPSASGQEVLSVVWSVMS